MLEKIKKNNKGFTLVELIVVIAILGVLMAVLVPQYIQYVEKSKQGTDASQIGEILHAAEVEAALQSTTPGVTTVKATSGTVAISGGLDTELGKIIGADTKFQSSKMAAFEATITYTTDGAKWTNNTAVDALITALKTGTATDALVTACK